jgi:hypothetical protein
MQDWTLNKERQNEKIKNVIFWGTQKQKREKQFSDEVGARAK